MSKQYVYIHCTNIGESNKEAGKNQYLKIDGKNINFLDDYIAQSIISEKSEDNKWKLRFFPDSSYSVEFYVYFNQNPRDKAKTYSNVLSSGIILDAYKLNEIKPSTFEEISLNLRNSKALTEQHYFNHPLGKYCIDGSGVAWISEVEDDLNAKRFIYLYLLARAYEFAMHKLINDFSKIEVKYNTIQDCNFDQLKQSYYQVCQFNLLHFTNFPVKSHNNLFKQIWSDLSTHFNLSELNSEITKQATEFKNIVEFEAAEKTSKLEKENHKKIQLYFLILAAVPIILTIVELIFE